MSSETDVFTTWAAQMREALVGYTNDDIIARLNAASRAVELYQAHENLAVALINFNAAMPKGASRIIPK